MNDHSPTEKRLKEDTITGISVPDLMSMFTDLLTKHGLTQFDSRMDKLDETLSKVEGRID